MAILAGKTLFITGASRGIGLAIALRAAQDGANIVIAAKTSEPHPSLPGTIHTAAAEVEAAGGHALPLVCDIRLGRRACADCLVQRIKLAQRVLQRPLGLFRKARVQLTLQ